MDIAGQHNNIGTDIRRHEIAELNMQITQDVNLQTNYLQPELTFRVAICSTGLKSRSSQIVPILVIFVIT
jgi:hypothetical protein